MTTDSGGRVRFRQSFATVSAVVVVLAGSVAIAGQGWVFTPVLLLPLAAFWWVLRSGVDVDLDGLTIQGPFNRRMVPWVDVAGFTSARGRVSVQLTEAAGGQALRLPAVTPGTLPRLLAAGDQTLVRGGVAAPTADDSA